MFQLNKLPPPVDKILTEYSSRLTAVHHDLIEGIYVTGSVALDDYYSRKSDIDFITVLKPPIIPLLLQK
jgi:hypothetical protein